MRTTVLAAILLLAGCKPQQSASNGQPTTEPLTVTSVTLHLDDKGKEGAEVKLFDYRQRNLHFRAVLSRPVKGVKGRWVFMAKSTSAGNNKDIQSIEGEVEGNEMRAQIELKSNWPVGTYHVDIVIDDKPVHGFDYEVTGEKTQLAFLGHSLAPDDGKGLPGKRVEVFKRTDRTLHIQVTSKGVDTTMPEIVWRLYRVEGKKSTELAQTVQPRIKLQDSVLTCQFNSPGDWKPGHYRADISVDGNAAHSISFEIE